MSVILMIVAAPALLAADQPQNVILFGWDGFNEGKTGHSFAPYVFLATNNEKVIRNGRRDVNHTTEAGY